MRYREDLYETRTPKAPKENVEYYSRINHEAKEKAVSTGTFVTVIYGGSDAPSGVLSGRGLTYAPSGVALTIGVFDKETETAADLLVELANEALQARKEKKG